MQLKINPTRTVIFAKRSFLATLISTVLILNGCIPATPQQRLTGHWVGAPNVAKEVSQGINTVGGNQPLNPAVAGAAQFLGQLAANTVLAIDLHLNPSGVVLVRGNAAALGLPPDADGTWRVQSNQGEIFQIELDFKERKIAAKLILVSPDEFTLKMNNPADKSDPTNAPAADANRDPAGSTTSSAKMNEVSITFKRNK